MEYGVGNSLSASCLESTIAFLTKHPSVCKFCEVQDTECIAGAECKFGHPPRTEVRQLWDYHDFTEQSEARALPSIESLAYARSPPPPPHTRPSGHIAAEIHPREEAEQEQHPGPAHREYTKQQDTTFGPNPGEPSVNPEENVRIHGRTE